MKLFFLVFFLFFLSCGDDVKEKVYDDCVMYEEYYNELYFSCTFLEIENEKICLDDNYIYNQFTKKCTKPICQKNDESCINGCGILKGFDLIKIVCGNEFIQN